MAYIHRLEKLLEATGYSHDAPEFYESRDIKLRDGRPAKLWVNREDGHGILDSDFWESSTYYQEQYRKEFSAQVDAKTDPSEHLAVYKDINRKQFEMFSDRVNSQTKYLEVGCSFGGVVQHLIPAGAKIVHAVEPNVEDANFVSNRIQESLIFNSYLEDANLEESYNIIASFEVLEHTSNPHNFVSKLVKHLAPEGFLNIEVPNHHDALLHCYADSGYKNFYYHKAHIHYFTPQSLKKLFARSGIEGDVKGFQMYPYTNQIHWIYNHSPMQSAHTALCEVPSFPTDLLATQKLSSFIQNTVDQYSKLVSDLLVSDCLVFQGVKPR